MLKRLIDFMLSLVALLILSPVILLLVVLIKVFIGSPVFFRQKRPGRFGKPFYMIKFRTMTNETGPDGNLLPDKDRLTKFGAFLRKTSLDELPELWNVLTGKMALVGPRPLLEEYLPYYTERERKRHDVRPGLTGLAQVSGRNNLLWDDRLELDVQYVENMSLWLDIKIILKTIRKVISSEDVVVIPSSKFGKLNEVRSKHDL